MEEVSSLFPAGSQGDPGSGALSASNPIPAAANAANLSNVAAVITAPHGSQPNTAAETSATIVALNSSAKRADRSNTVNTVPPLPPGPKGPKPGRSTIKYKLHQMQFVIGLELGVLNSLCDTEVEVPSLDDLEAQFQAEILGDYRDRVNTQIRDVQDAMHRISDSPDQGYQFIEQASEDERPKLVEFMEEFSDENFVIEHKAAGTRLINRLKKLLNEADNHLARLRRRECSALSMNRSQESGSEPAHASRPAVITANDERNVRGFSHSTPIPEEERPVITGRKANDTRIRDPRSAFDSAADQPEEHAVIGGSTRPEREIRGLHRVNERGSIERIDGETDGDDFVISDGDHHRAEVSRGPVRDHDSVARPDGRMTTEISVLPTEPATRVGSDRRGNFELCDAPPYRGRSRSRDNPNTMNRVRFPPGLKGEVNTSPDIGTTWTRAPTGARPPPTASGTAPTGAPPRPTNSGTAPIGAPPNTVSRDPPIGGAPPGGTAGSGVITPRPESAAFGNTFYMNSPVFDQTRTYIATQPNVLEMPYKKNFCPVFSGDRKQWPVFRDRFIQLVEGAHPPIPDHRKLQLLLDHLQGDPQELFQHVPLTDENYDVITSMLDKRYGVASYLESELILQLKALPNPENTAVSLQQFHDKSFVLAAQLKQAGANLQARSELTRIWLAKIPPKLLEERIFLWVPKEERCLDRILGALQDVIEQKLDVDTNVRPWRASDPRPQNAQNARSGRNDRNQNGFQHRHGRGQVHAARAEPKAERRSPYCSLCPADGHWPADCTTYPDPDSRWTRVKQMALCYICLRKEQWRGQCKEHTEQCRVCHAGKHHRSPCKKYATDQSRNTQKRNRSPPPSSGKDRKPRSGRKVKFERGPKREKRGTNASVSIPVDQPDSNSGQDSEEDELTPYEAYMSTLTPEDCPNYPDRPVISPRPDWESETESEISDYSESDSDQSSDCAAYGSVVLNRTNGHETACLLECARTQLFNPVTGKIVESNVFFDGGSTHSYVHSSLAERLSLPKLSKSSLIVNTFGRDEPVKLNGYDSRIGFRPKNGKALVLDVTTSDHVTSNMEAVFISAKDLPALIADKCAIVPSEQKVEVLIGRRDFHHFKRTESESLPCGFEIVKTNLGPILAGYGYVGTQQSDPTARTCLASAEDSLHKVADAFWHIERTGMESSKPRADDEMVYERVRAETVINEDGRYEVPLVFKTPNGEPPSNLELPQQKQASIGRLESELRKLHKSPKILGQYKEYLEGLIARGEAEIIPIEEIKTPNTSHYLAHHDVVKETSSTTKVRPVHDASAHPKGRPSLNDKLHRGPGLLPKIAGCLLRSRFARMIILSDIAKAFLQVSVKPSHRDLLRWFWVKDVNKPVSIENLLHIRFTRVPFGLKISPFLLAAVLEQHFQKYDSPVAREMLRSCYVDNVMLTAETVSEALQKYQESKQICADAKMQLREFVSNSIEFNESIPVEDRADTGNLKNLGIPWQCIEDDWVISLHPKDAHPSMTYGKEAADQPSSGCDMRGSPLTLRKMLSQLMAVYDPCGLTNPLMVAAKLVVQKMWEGKPAWDQAVPEHVEEAWKEAIADFATTAIRIPRRVCDGPIAEARLHVFCDASADAYGFCTYLVCRSANGEWKSNLLFSRNNVKPLGQAKSLTIPRMEMMGLLKGSANIPFTVEELGFPVQGIFLWSDSMIAIHQVLSPEKTQETWLENRLQKIRQICRTHNVTVGHVRTDENPADHTSRGLLATELQSCKLWWHGPEWLRKDPSEFPPQPETIQVATEKWLDQASAEIAHPSDDGDAIKETAAAIAARPNPPYIPPRHAIACFGNIARINSASAPAEIPPDNLLPEEQMARCQSWQKLRRVHATVLRACAIFLRTGRAAADQRPANYLGADLRDHFRESYSKRSKVQHFTVPELGLVESFLVRKAQAQHPPTVYDRKLLEIFSDGHFLRVRGRIAQSGLPESAHSPIYLSRNNSLIKLLILHYHVANVHATVGTTLANVRLHYWFTHGRRTVQSVIRSMCFECQRLINPAFKAPPAPQLPEERVKPSCPFKAVGIDFFGPKLLRSIDHNGKTETKKFWVCIFVCTWSRACHLELCSDLSTEQFLHAFQRFCGRRGSPSHILSDNGATLLSGREVLRKIRTVQAGGKSASADKQPPADTLAPVVVQRPTRSTRGIAAQRFDPTPIPGRRGKNKRSLEHSPPAEATLRPQQAAYVPSQPHPAPSTDGPRDAERSQQATGSPEQDDPSGGAGELSPSSACAAVITAEKGQRNVREANGNPLNNGLHNQGTELSDPLRPVADPRVGVCTGSAHAAPLSVITEHACHSRRASQTRRKLSNDLSKADELWAQLSERGAVWRTITPRASWFGGSFERIIGLVKHCLARVLGRSVPRVEDFHSLLARAEWTINSRPLTYVSNSEFDFVLVRPVDFLLPGLQFESSIELFDAPYDDNPDPDYVAPGEHKQHVRIISNLQHLTRLTDKFWKLFQERVLLELRRDHGKKGKNTPVREIQPGDVVLLYEEDLPRAQWRPALVTGLVQSKDGTVRSANIRLPSGCETARKTLLPTTTMEKRGEGGGEAVDGGGGAVDGGGGSGSGTAQEGAGNEANATRVQGIISAARGGAEAMDTQEAPPANPGPSTAPAAALGGSTQAAPGNGADVQGVWRPVGTHTSVDPSTFPKPLIDGCVFKARIRADQTIEDREWKNFLTDGLESRGVVAHFDNPENFLPWEILQGYSDRHNRTAVEAGCKSQLQRLTGEWLQEANEHNDESEKEIALNELEKLTTELEVVQKTSEMQNLIIQAETYVDILGDYRENVQNRHDNSRKAAELQEQVDQMSLRQYEDRTNVPNFGAQASSNIASTTTQKSWSFEQPTTTQTNSIFPIWGSSSLGNEHSLVSGHSLGSSATSAAQTFTTFGQAGSAFRPVNPAAISYTSTIGQPAPQQTFVQSYVTTATAATSAGIGSVSRLGGGPTPQNINTTSVSTGNTGAPPQPSAGGQPPTGVSPHRIRYWGDQQRRSEIPKRRKGDSHHRAGHLPHHRHTGGHQTNLHRILP